MNLLKLFPLFIFILSTNSYAQENAEKNQISDATYIFTAVKNICIEDNGHLWGENLYRPTVLINTNTRFFIANDSLPIDNCEKQKLFFTGYLPNTYAIANSTLKIDSKNYASIRYSSNKPFDTSLYIRTFIHEMFHVFVESNIDDNIHYNNTHIDTKNGRIYLQLELLALKKALTNNGTKQMEALKEALCFRNKRQSFFPEAKENENNFEIHEGLPTYTEYCLGIFSEKMRIEVLLNMIGSEIEAESRLRSFGYSTGAAYAFLNDKSDSWRKTIFQERDLSKMTMSIYGINTNDIDTSNLKEYLKKYDAIAIFAKEDSLENIKEVFKKNSIEKLNNTRLLIVDLEDNSFSVTSGMVQLDSIGTYFPYMNLSGKFGYIRSKKPAVIKWTENKCFFFLDDIIIENNKSNSTEMEMEINEGFRIEKKDRFYQLTNENTN